MGGVGRSGKPIRCRNRVTVTPDRLHLVQHVAQTRPRCRQIRPGTATIPARGGCAAAVDTPTVTKPKHGPVPCRGRGIVPLAERYTRLSMGRGGTALRGTVPAVRHSALVDLSA